MVSLTSPALTPSWVNATSSPTFTPSLFTVVSPALTLSTTRSLFSLTVTLSSWLGGDVVVAGNGHGRAEFSILVLPLSPLKVRPLLSTVVLASTPFWMSSLVSCAKSMLVVGHVVRVFC